MPYRIARLFSSVYRSLYFPPALIALAIITATFVTWHSARVSLANDTDEAVSERITSTETSIKDTLSSYEEILQGGVGLFRGSSDVTAIDWGNYLHAYDIKRNYPSAQTIGFMRVVQAGDIDSYTAYMRSQPGLESYAVHPVNPGTASYAPLSYAVAIASQSPVNYGIDGYSDPARKEAMFEARDTGTTALTGMLQFHPTPTTSYNGFGVFVPYYGLSSPTTIAARRAAINGYVYASFRADLFFGHSTADAATRTSAYRVRIGDTNGVPLYQSSNYAAITKQHGIVRATRTLHLYGQDWNIDYAFQHGALLSDIQIRRPTAVLVAGSFSATLIALVILLLLRARAHELTVQKERAVELAKDELLSLASHQLRTPATGVKQYLGMLLQGFAGDVPRNQMQLIEKAYTSNDRQLHIINEILHLAKIESGRIILARQETDLSALLQDIIAEEQPDIDAAKHRLTIETPKRPLILNIDAHTLRMAIENLISNAIKYTPKGGEITIKLFKTRSHAFLRVRDSGVGVAQQDIEKLFKQFSRLPNEMSLSVGGTGIGLYLAKHLVELHGGTITVKTTPGKGSTFTIILPLDDIL